MNILSDRARCRHYCRRKALEWSRRGDVERCEHGRIIYCWCVGQRWQYLSPIWNPIKYRRAVRALSGTDQ